MCSVKRSVTKQSVFLSTNDSQYGAAQEEIASVSILHPISCFLWLTKKSWSVNHTRAVMF